MFSVVCRFMMPDEIQDVASDFPAARFTQRLDTVTIRVAIEDSVALCAVLTDKGIPYTVSEVRTHA